MSRPARFAPLALALGLCGCALGPAIPPSVEVMDVRLSAVDLLQQRLAVTLCVSNPNADELAFRRVTAELDLSGFPALAGASDQPVRVPPRSSSAVPFTVVTTVQNLGPQVLGVLRTGRIEYRLHGTVTLGGALPFTLPYSRSGQFTPLGDGFGQVGAGCAPPARQAAPAAT